jgi:hypothetical protein
MAKLDVERVVADVATGAQRKGLQGLFGGRTPPRAVASPEIATAPRGRFCAVILVRLNTVPLELAPNSIRGRKYRRQISARA